MIYLFSLSLFWLVSVFFGYRLVIAFLHKFHSKEAPAKELHLPKLTLIVPCFNEEESVEKKILNSLALDYPAELLQIIFIDDHSSDRTGEILGAWESRGVHVVRNNKGLGKTASLKKSLASSTGDVLVFSDCTALLNPSALKDLVGPLGVENVGLVTGTYHCINLEKNNRAEGEETYWDMEMKLKMFESDLQTTTIATGALYAVKRELFEKIPIGKTIINDDMYLPIKILCMGYNVKYSPNAIATEKLKTTIQQEFDRRTRIAAGNLQMISLVPDLLKGKRIFPLFQLIFHKWLRNLVGMAVILQLISVIALVETSLFQFLLLAWLGVFILALASFFPKFLPKIIRPIASYCMYFLLASVAGMKGLFRILFIQVNPQWEKTSTV